MLQVLPILGGLQSNLLLVKLIRRLGQLALFSIIKTAFFILMVLVSIESIMFFLGRGRLTLMLVLLKAFGLTNGGPFIQALSFDGEGRLWAGNTNAAYLNQIDPDTMLQIGSLSAGAGSGAGLLGIVQHPVSGDLYFNSRTDANGNGGIHRLDIGSADAITLYSHNSGDGIAFDASLNLLYAEGPNVYVVPGPTPGVPPVAENQIYSGGCTTDGIAVSADNKLIFVNCNEGQVNQINTTDRTVKTIFSDTYRGDFCIVGSDGCIYFTHENGSIWQLCPKNGIPKIIPTPQGSSCDAFKVASGLDYFGCDLNTTTATPNPFILKDTIDQCCAACLAYPTCNGFTEHKDFGTNTKYCCWLKHITTSCPATTPPTSQSSTGTTNGFKSITRG